MRIPVSHFQAGLSKYLEAGSEGSEIILTSGDRAIARVSAVLYLQQAHSEEVRRLVIHSTAIAVSRITWVEMLSALARRQREHAADTDILDQARARQSEDWPTYVKLDVSQSVLNTAGTFAGNFALRAHDSVQLASAVALAASVEGVGFSCFDLRLNSAAQALGLLLAPSTS